MAPKNDKPKEVYIDNKKLELENVKLDPKSKALLMAEEERKKDEKMLKELGIDVPREEVLMMRGINDTDVFAFFDLRDMSLIRWASGDVVRKAIAKTNKERI